MNTRLWVHLWQRKGVSLGPGLHPLGSTTPSPACYTNAGNSLQVPLGEGFSPRPFSQFNIRKLRPVEMELFFFSRSVAEHEVMPQALDPKLYAQLLPAAAMPALLSLGMQFYTSISASSSLSPHSQQSEDNQHRWVLAALWMLCPGSILKPP